MAHSRDLSPEPNPLSLGDLHYSYGDNESDGSRNGEADTEAIAPLPAYKAAGEIVIDFESLLNMAPALRLREDLSEGCGGQTWPAGMVLAKHMLRYRRPEAANARILELGAGGGLVGLAVALAKKAEGGNKPAEAGPSMYITDQKPMFTLMEHNIALNGLQNDVKALILNWGEPLPEEVCRRPPSIVLAADCVYFEPAFPLLLSTMEDLLALDENMVIYFCFKKRRRADNQFVKKAQKKFCITEIVDEDRPIFSREGLFLYTFRRREIKSIKSASKAKTQAI